MKNLKEGSAKKPYTTPKLTKHGNFAKVVRLRKAKTFHETATGSRP
jgi:hypothetical protein